jgi:D-amino peptidase
MKKTFMILLALGLAAALVSAQKPSLKVYVSVDMEGIWGVVNAEQTSATGPDYGPARKWMAHDVSAVIAGLFEAGATEVIVNDSHGGMRNILAEDLDARASLISGTPKPLAMMQGIDASYDACIFVGYHARAGTANSVLDHTISGGTVRAFKVNGMDLPELGINGAIAGYYNVPVVMLSGDAETCAQAKAVLGSELVTVAVKESYGRSAAKMLPQDEARRLLKEGAKQALLKRAKVVPFKLAPPLHFELEFLNSQQAELPCLLPQAKRTSARSVAFTSADYVEGFKLARAMIALAGIQ